MKKALSLALAAVLVICAFALGAVSVSADTVDVSDKVRFHAFEEPSEFSEKATSVILNTSDKDTQDLLNGTLGAINADRTASKGHTVVTLNGKAYDVTHYVNSGDWYRLNIGEAGATVMSGITYNVKVEFYDENDAVAAKAEYNVVSGMTSKGVEDKRTGQDVIVSALLNKITVDPATAVATGINPWNAEKEGVASLFDGDFGRLGEEGSGTKLGGNGVNGSFDVTFKTAEPTTVHYYALYTGGDTQKSPNRNPIGWTLSGSNDGGKTWTVIDTVDTNEQHVTGLGAENSTPHTYKAAAPAAYTDYKITFKCAGGDFQMNELVLFNDPSAKEPTTPPTQGGQPGGTDKPNPPATGDIALALSVISLIAVTGAVVIAKRRKIED